MSANELIMENLARRFHDYHDVFTPYFQRVAPARHESWDEIPDEERSRLVAAIRLVVADALLAAEAPERENYFAKPGEAEWGC